MPWYINTFDLKAVSGGENEQKAMNNCVAVLLWWSKPCTRCNVCTRSMLNLLGKIYISMFIIFTIVSMIYIMEDTTESVILILLLISMVILGESFNIIFTYERLLGLAQAEQDEQDRIAREAEIRRQSRPCGICGKKIMDEKESAEWMDLIEQKIISCKKEHIAHDECY